MILQCLAMMTWAGGTYFSNATIYDEDLHTLRVDAHIWVDGSGTVRGVAYGPFTPEEPATTVDEAVVLPHLSDFYSLIQDRGLGLDEDISAEAQGRIARYLKAAGFFAVRDPVFPPAGLGNSFAPFLKIFAQRGYLEVPGGPGQPFCLIADPEQAPAVVANQVPENGPVTLWWTSHGTDARVRWHEHAEFTGSLIDYFRGKGRKVGCYIQDATTADLAELAQFDLDFLEGIPSDSQAITPERFPNSVWVPLAALNDRRYCAKNLEKRIPQVSRLGLYDKVTLARAEGRVDSIVHRIRERCLIWKNRRTETLAPVRGWLKQGGAVAVGSCGGHLFSFTGDIRSEIEILDELGASQSQLLQAVFTQTPELLGSREPYLEQGKPAHFIVYRKNSYWGKLIGTAVDFNYVNGTLVPDKLPLERQLP